MVMVLLSSLVLVIVSGFLVARVPGIVTAGLCVIAAYAVFNSLRVLARHQGGRPIMADANRTAVGLVIAYGGLVGCLIFTQWWSVSIGVTIAIVSIVQLLVAGLLLINVRRQLQKSQISKAATMSVDALPSVTVAIAARNEDGQLEACLGAMLASNYPKLEILALDDGSEDRTPEIIRQFAQRGVRFIQASRPSVGWLPKNRAYAELAATASGEYILFCGSDIRLEAGSIRSLIETMLGRHKTMLSVMPQNTVASRPPVLQAMRYYWEIAPPRRLFQRPPVLGSCWLVSRQLLERSGGFAAVRRSVTPEAYFARQAMAVDGYSFLRNRQNLGITSEKSAAEQRETAIYSRYSQLRRRPEIVLLVTLAEAGLLLGPLLTTLVALVASVNIIWVVMALVAFGLNSLAFALIQTAVFSRASSLSAWYSFLPAVIADIFYMHYSMYAYEFGQVFWKGRDITLPVTRRL